MHPLDPAKHALRLVGLAPRLTDRLDLHLAPAVGLVAERERRRLAGRRDRDRQPERRETIEIRSAFRLAALGDDDRLLPQRP